MKSIMDWGIVAALGSVVAGVISVGLMIAYRTGLLVQEVKGFREDFQGVRGDIKELMGVINEHDTRIAKLEVVHPDGRHDAD